MNITVKPPNFDMSGVRPMGVIGEGAFGTVLLYRNPTSNEEFAVKRMRKRHIIEQKQVDHIKNEVYILNACKHPFVVGMHGITQDSRFILLVMDFIRGGEFFNYLRSVHRVPPAQTIFYAA